MPAKNMIQCETCIIGVSNVIQTIKAIASLLTLAVLFAAPLSANASDSNAGKDECIDKWMESDAARTCLPTSIVATPAEEAEECSFVMRCIINMDCTAENPCDENSGALVRSGLTWQGSINNVSSLQNCRGSIQTWSCNASSAHEDAVGSSNR